MAGSTVSTQPGWIGSTVRAKSCTSSPRGWPTPCMKYLRKALSSGFCFLICASVNKPKSTSSFSTNWSASPLGEGRFVWQEGQRGGVEAGGEEGVEGEAPPPPQEFVGKFRLHLHL